MSCSGVTQSPPYLPPIISQRQPTVFQCSARTSWRSRRTSARAPCCAAAPSAGGASWHARHAPRRSRRAHECRATSRRSERCRPDTSSRSRRAQVVLAYSGGLDTSIILKWLKDTYNCEARARGSPVTVPPLSPLHVVAGLHGRVQSARAALPASVAFLCSQPVQPAA